MVCNEAILSEYLEVLNRTRFRLDSEKVLKIVQFIRSRGMLAPALARSFKLPDANDEPFLEAALAAGADALVTENIKHFPEEACKGVRVLSPARLLQSLNAGA